jgi:hypothetical protein
MAINFTWDIKQVDVYPTLDENTNVIYNVHWELIAEDDANQDSKGKNLKAENIGVQHLDTSDLSGFVDFNSVSSSQVETWIENAMGSEMLEMHKQSLRDNIEKQITPTTIAKTLEG